MTSLSLISMLENFVETTSADVAYLRSAAQVAAPFDDYETRAVASVQRVSPGLDEVAARALIKEPFRRLLREVQTASAQGTAEALEGLLPTLSDLARDPITGRYVQVMLRVATRRSVAERARIATFVMCVAAFEFAVGELSVVLAAVPPGAVGVASSEALDGEARAAYAALSRKPADLRLEGLDVSHGIRPADTSAILELIGRRNALTHADGRSDDMYAKRSGVSTEQWPEGSLLPVSQAYLDDAIVTMQAVLTDAHLGALSLYKVDPADPVVAGALSFAVRLMSVGQDRLALRVVEWVVTQSIVDSELRARAHVNKWFLMQRVGKGARVLQEVERWDGDAVGPLFGLARLVLLGRVGDAEARARRLVSERTLDIADIRAQPLFAVLVSALGDEP
ncbi:hypothetical protein [Demequina sp.]|uniref:hypothetical protein n=1 Tax=Demequina sp. TaxID=2050685 RepID=UPI003D0EFDA5